MISKAANVTEVLSAVLDHTESPLSSVSCRLPSEPLTLKQYKTSESLHKLCRLSNVSLPKDLTQAQAQAEKLDRPHDSSRSAQPKRPAMPGVTDGVISGVRVVLVDVDNTLYAPTSGLLPAINANVDAYLVAHMGNSALDAPAARDAYVVSGGLALAGLLAEGDARFDADAFIAEVYGGLDYSLVQHDPRIGKLLQEMAGRGARRVWLSSNQHKEHVLAVLDALGVPASAYDGVVEARGLGYKIKPCEETFSLAMRAIGDCDRREVLLVDDSWDNVEAAREFGMQAVHISNASDAICDAPGCQDHQALVQSPRNSTIAKSCIQNLSQMRLGYPDLFA
jgi:putative hydrolase of the HAD superfamily